MNDSACWYFPEMGVLYRTSFQTELFKKHTGPEQLVREFCQNSLDVRREKKPVLIRFRFGVVSTHEIEGFIKNLPEHIEACKGKPGMRGLIEAYYSFLTVGPKGLPFLDIEDFGTPGLDGDTGENARELPNSNFSNFMYREGESGKTGAKAGRWGLGRTAFHNASRLRFFWALTTRWDDKRELLIGRALLAPHRLDETDYENVGFFAAGPGEFRYLPITDPQILKNFKQKFSVTRRNEPGFSLVIPMPQPEIKPESIMASAVAQYFYPILKGDLIVEIWNGDDKKVLNSENLLSIARNQDWEGTSWKKKTGDEIQSLLQFVTEAVRMRPFNLNIGDGFSIGEEQFGNWLDDARKDFNDGKTIAIQVPVTVRPKEDSPVQSFFNIYLKKHPQIIRAEEYYIRSGIIISGERRQLGSYPIYGLLLAEDKGIAGFLGDCEDTTHTEWNEEIGDFKYKYDNAVKTLRFIKNSMMEVASLIYQPPTKILTDLLKDVFFVPSRLMRVGEREEIVEPPKETKKKLPLFEVSDFEKGFRISLTETGQALCAKKPFTAEAEVAYDTWRGNPFRRYDPSDFDLASMLLEQTGCKVLDRKHNRIRFLVSSSDFALKVTGFDPNRIIIVDVEVES